MEAFAALIVVALVVGVILVIPSLVTVDQATCAVITMFGKYRRIMGPGLHVKIPLIEKVHLRIPVQNQSVELAFQATTQDQANVNFSAMLLYTVSDDSEATITKVAFKFVNSVAFMQALTRTIEGTIRAFVATKRQAEILGLRTEIVRHVKDELDVALDDWWYRLLDRQINDISFGTSITTSMERVVASQNERTAAENEGAALLIRETKRAEAEGAAIKIAAAAEMEAARLRGQGVAAFRQEVATGMAEAARATEAAGLDPSFVLFAMWTESLRHIAENGRGNLITLDGSPSGLEQTLRQMMAVSGNFATLAATNPTPPADRTAPTHPEPGDGAAAGWYPDPYGAASRRWWDGSTWTDAVE
ncbi:MAG: SPFH domain-containing protein [Actinomycetes bacterium]